MAGRKSTATMELAIGATIIAGIIILIVMLMAWGNSTSLLGRHYRLVVNMANVGGLKEGAPVKMGGFQIGRVATIQIQPGGTNMEIVLDIDENRLLPKGSTAKVSTAGLVGDAFMEIIPGKSADMLKRSATVADAERLDSSPLPDISELFTKVNEFGDQLTILTTNLNDVIGDPEFRKRLKSMAINVDNVSYQANLILQRSQSVIDNIELATQNVAKLSDTLKDRVEKISDAAMVIADDARTAVSDVKDAIGTAKEAVELAKTTITTATRTIDNIDGGVTDARVAIKNTIGSEAFATSLTSSISNINTVTSLLAKRNDSLDRLITNIDGITGELRSIAGHVKGITEGIDPKTIPTTMKTLNTAIVSMTEVVEQIKKEPVLALSINKAADRIVKMKFDEMSKNPQFRRSDAVLQEINRWIRDNMDRGGYLRDPSHPYNARPYIMDSVKGESVVIEQPTTAVPAKTVQEKRPYMIER